MFELFLEQYDFKGICLHKVQIWRIKKKRFIYCKANYNIWQSHIIVPILVQYFLQLIVCLKNIRCFILQLIKNNLTFSN